MAQLHQTLVFIRTLKPLHHLNIIFSKHNITLFTNYYAKYLKKFKIRVNTISPGGVNYKLKKVL